MANFQQLEANKLILLLSTHLSSSFIVKNTLNYLYLALFILFSLLIVYLLRKLLILRLKLKEKHVILEITPPVLTEKEAYTTEQLFALIHALGQQKSLKDKLIGRKIQFSLEIVSTKNEGIKYLIKTTPNKANILRKTLISYLPQITIKEVNDYLPASLKGSGSMFKIIEYKLTRHFAYPLKKQNLLDKHDPISYITGMMTKLNPSELVSLQIILTPVKSKETKKIAKFILKNGDIIHYLNSIWVFRYLSRAPNKNIENKSSSEENLVKEIEEKIKQPLFETHIRILLVSDSKENILERLSGINSNFVSFSSSNYQSLSPRRYVNINPINNLLFLSFKKRLSLLNKSLLSASEISSIYHFPFTSKVNTEDLVKTLSPELPAPLSLKKGRDLDVIFGKNTYGNTTVDIGLTDEERAKHIYLIGRTGSGKSTAMFHMAAKDIQKGRGLAVIDPHGDLAEDLLSTVPIERINDLIYFNPFDLKYPIGINLLELPEGLKDDELELEKELVAEGVISVFRRVFSKEDYVNAHRIEYILRNTIYTSFYIEGRTIFTIYNLLNNPSFRDQVTRKVDDENLTNFWKYEFAKAGNFQAIKMAAGVTAKVGRFLFSPTAKRIMEQAKSTINFDDILDNKKILICNLSEGRLGEDTAQILGLTIISKIQQAALRRTRKELSLRTPFYLYVDEFQNFATTSFTKILSGGRKFGLRMTLAEQSTSQQQDRNVVNVILANTGTVICFATASTIDEQMMQPEFAPYITKQDLANLPNHRFYIKMSAINPEEPFSGETIKVTLEKDKEKIEKLIQASRKNYAIVYKKPEPRTQQKGNSKKKFGKRENGKTIRVMASNQKQ